MLMQYSLYEILLMPEGTIFRDKSGVEYIVEQHADGKDKRVRKVGSANIMPTTFSNLMRKYIIDNDKYKYVQGSHYATPGDIYTVSLPQVPLSICKVGSTYENECVNIRKHVMDLKADENTKMVMKNIIAVIGRSHFRYNKQPNTLILGLNEYKEMIKYVNSIIVKENGCIDTIIPSTIYNMDIILMPTETTCIQALYRDKDNMINTYIQFLEDNNNTN